MLPKLTQTDLQKLAIMLGSNNPRQRLEAFLILLALGPNRTEVDKVVGELLDIGDSQNILDFKVRLSLYLGKHAIGMDDVTADAFFVFANCFSGMSDNDAVEAVRNYKLWAGKMVVEKDSFTTHISQRFIDQVN